MIKPNCSILYEIKQKLKEWFLYLNQANQTAPE